jgi:hypothetical protein
VILDSADGDLVQRYVRPSKDITITGPGEEARCEFVLEVPAELTAVIIGHDGAPLEEASVALKYPDVDIWRSHWHPGVRQGAGVRVWSGLQSGEYMLQVAAEGHLPGTHRGHLEVGESAEVRLTLQRGGATIRGQFLRPERDSVPDHTWSIYLLRTGDTPEAVQAIWTGRIDSEGSFEAGGLDAGEYEIIFLNSPLHLTLHAVVSGGDADLGDVDLSPLLATGSSSVSVSFRCVDTRPFGASVLYRRSGWPGSVWKRVRLQNQGRPIVLEGLEEGTYEFRFSPAALDPSKFSLDDHALVRLVAHDASVAEVELMMPVLR